MVRTAPVQRLGTLLALALLFAGFLSNPVATYAQEKKNLRMVFVSLAWNSEIPFRVALARGFFKAQGIQIEPILIRGGPAAIAALTSGEVDFASIGGASGIPQQLAWARSLHYRFDFQHDELCSPWQQANANH